MKDTAQPRKTLEKKGKEDVKQLVGICGLYCGTCPKYLAPRNQDREYINQNSRETGYPPEEIRCDGCLSEHVFPSCRDCRHGFRRCAEEKGVTWCFECREFPCQRLRDFLPIHVVNGISHHARLIEELMYLKEHGVEAWLKKQDREGRCPQCGKMLYWYDRICSGCQTPINRPSR